MAYKSKQPTKTTIAKNSPEIAKNGAKLNDKDIAYGLLRENGLNNTQASAGIGITTSRGSQIAKKLDKKYDLTEKNFLNSAQKAIKNILKGKTFGEVTAIKDSTVLAAANMVYDRVQPVVKQNMNLNVNRTFIDINMSGYE